MPRKSKKPRKPGGATRVTQPRPSRRTVTPNQTRPTDGLDRHRRPDRRMPTLPGRHGNR